MTVSDKEKVATQKRAGVENPKQFLKKLDLSSCTELEKLLSYRKSLDYADEVDFDKCRSFFKAKLPKGSYQGTVSPKPTCF